MLSTMKIFAVILLWFGTGVMATMPSVDEFWPSVRDDLSKVTWSHATNSKQALLHALQDADIMMIEADILMGHVTGEGNQTLQPIMAHPPHTTSDLSFADFIHNILIAVDQDDLKKGIKLDFKQLEAVKPCLDLLAAQEYLLYFPVWLNADILSGPVEAPRTPVDADAFLSICSQALPLATLSVGWTTQYTNADDPRGKYTLSHCSAMVDALNLSLVNQTVTFPVRAAFVRDSIQALTWLLDAVGDSTLTVWSSASDDVDIPSLVELQIVAGADGVYYDLPPKQRQEFDRLRPIHKSSSTRIFTQTTFLYLTMIAAVGAAVLSLFSS